MRHNTTAKYRAIQDAFSEMYRRGMRTEVIYDELKKRFFLSQGRLEKIMKLDLPETNQQENDDSKNSVGSVEPANSGTQQARP